MADARTSLTQRNQDMLAVPANRSSVNLSAGTENVLSTY